jgi:hypothetical protein
MLSDILHHAFYPSKTMTWRAAFLLAGILSPFALIAASGLYLAKTALGINLMPGPSPLHDLLFWMLV